MATWSVFVNKVVAVTYAARRKFSMPNRSGLSHAERRHNPELFRRCLRSFYAVRFVHAA
jgi:hypothetical protein